ncbi:alpha/beta hydrolase family protein [Tamaricihabitans halophyticus]|uniref:Alpha/beta hydrolase family protein n=1 Tax=Tamaricihabitans halophyticus TaxID=1262583 RepID=A0A4V2ST96_9PSEU|nr:alpha/beta fold hydrolase [Tamaricihabitans halophyticus]TCP49306.1 alpha/beta hydrolase family protein [Tamaricihabitans halophyticus]
MVRRIAIALVVGLGLTVAAVSAFAFQQQDTAEPAAAGIEWRDCQDAPAGQGARCGTVRVPIDWRNPQAAGSIDLRVAKLPATDPERRIGALLFNPGGPGGSAAGILTEPNATGMYFPERLRERFDIIGVDPRGVAGSTQVRCANPPHDPGQSRFPDTAAGTRKLAENNRAYAESCRAQSGDLVRHLDTGSVARDLDAVRAALGEEQISFLGISYGTMLAQDYAERFPNRLRALVLDGAVDRSLPWRQLVRDGAAAAENGVYQFATWCAGEQTCALSGRQVSKVITDLYAAADAGRLTAVVDGPQAGETEPAGEPRPVTAEEVALAINSGLGVGRNHPELARALRTAVDDGDATKLVSAAPFMFGERYNSYRTIACQSVPLDDSASTDLPAEGKRAAEQAPTLRGYSEFWNIASGCLGWPYPTSWQSHSWSVPENFPTTLVLSGAHDVATPRHWSENVYRQLPDAELVRWAGAGHTAWLNDQQARDQAVNYLLDGPSTG